MTCESCGVEISGKGKSNFCFRCAHRARRKPRRRKDGYIVLHLPEHPIADKRGDVFQHHLVLFEAGILVPKGHSTHHINGVKDDNWLENLEVLTQAEHVQIHARERQPTHCPQGHEYTPENSGFRKNGWRYCATCNRERVRAYAIRRQREKAGLPKGVVPEEPRKGNRSSS